MVGERGEIDGEIRVGRLFVSGLVRGEVHVTKRLSIHARGRVEGDGPRPALVVDEGGVLEGRCAMQGEAIAAESLGGAGAPAASTTVPGAAKVVGRILANKDR